MNCVSRKDFDSLQIELNYWQNITIKKHLIEGEIMCVYIHMVRTMSIVYNSGDGPNHCSVEKNSYSKDGHYKKIEGILTQMQGIMLELTCSVSNSQLATQMENLTQMESKVETIAAQLSHPPLGSFLNPVQIYIENGCA